MVLNTKEITKMVSKMGKESFIGLMVAGIMEISKKIILKVKEYMSGLMEESMKDNG